MTEKNEVKATRKEEEKESMSNEKIAIKLAALMGRRCGEAATEFRKAHSLKEHQGLWRPGRSRGGGGPADSAGFRGFH